MRVLIAAATCSSSLMRMRGAASNRVTCDPKALKIEATCTPVAPAPITSSESGAEVEAPGVAVGGGELEARAPGAVATRRRCRR